MLLIRPFSDFPKSRPPLPPEFVEIYADHYKKNRNGGSTASSLSQKMESWMHRKVAEDVRTGKPKSTLELGAGTLNHLQYEKHSAPYDIVEPFRYLFESSAKVDRIRNVYSDIKEIPRGTKYDRVISIATFEHICNLPEVVAQCGLLMAHDAQIRVAIPSEGTILWKLGWQFTTGIEFRLKHKLDYSLLMKHEHVNTAAEIEDILRYFFSQVESSFFGFSKSLSFYQFYNCSKPSLTRCTQFIGSLRFTPTSGLT
jgi:hypothetical protein